MAQAPATADAFYQLGIKYSVGDCVPLDFVSAHKWFNLAAMKGNREAVRLRQEIAASMSPGEIAEAQRAARAWLASTRH
ncbi:MAG: SEL1-like repeat protein [Pseudorhodoplanes sp.]|nr:SEL1-like repeat protein [Pseudorhodoplanes sp.]